METSSLYIDICERFLLIEILITKPMKYCGFILCGSKINTSLKMKKEGRGREIVLGATNVQATLARGFEFDLSLITPSMAKHSPGRPNNPGHSRS